MTRTGLDTKNNKIDALIGTFGYICLRLTYYPQACRIETELLAMMRRLSPDAEAVANELRRLDM
jgi:hypothetical protein